MNGLKTEPESCNCRSLPDEQWMRVTPVAEWTFDILKPRFEPLQADEPHVVVNTG